MGLGNTEINELEELRRENEALRDRCVALAAEARRFRVLVDQSHDAVALIDAAGCLAWLSPAGERIAGCPAEALLGRPFAVLLDAADRPRATAGFARLLANPREILRAEARVDTGAGEPRWVEVIARNLLDEPDVGAIAAWVREVTAQHRAEDALSDSRALHRALFEESPAASCLVDVETLRLLAANDAMVRQYGYAREELLAGVTLADLGAPEDVAVLLAPLRAGSPHHTVALPQRRKDRSIFSAEVESHLVRVGGRDACLIIARDRTAHHRLEEQFRQAQKMEAIGRLAGGVAHDFNNLLTVILSYTTLALQELPDDAPLHADMEEVVRAGHRAADLTRQLLAFSRQQVLRPRVIDLNEVLASMRKMVRRLLNEDIELVELLGARLGLIEADPGQIEQVLMNLLVNARDAMPRGGRVTLETANVRVTAAGLPFGLALGDYVVLTVSDNGIGMDRATRTRIFEPFFTTKERGKGTGLGLSTVFGIVQQSGGHVEVESEPGAGATFRIYFPRRDARVDSARQLPIIGGGGGGRRGDETILLVEDADDVRAIMRSTLKRGGYRVLDAQNAGEAFLVSDQHEGRIDLLITDVVMPRMNGYEMAARLKPRRPAMKVLYVSGYTEADVLESISAENAPFLQKPITPEQLLGKVRSVLDAAPRDGAPAAAVDPPPAPPG